MQLLLLKVTKFRERDIRVPLMIVEMVGKPGLEVMTSSPASGQDRGLLVFVPVIDGFHANA
jgi:hypothetical protein